MDVFILGIERSATTWIANILEAHPRTEVYMEPLSMYTSCFKDWPSRMEKINQREKYAEYFIKEFNKLKRDKKFLLTHMYDSNFAWQKDFSLAQLLAAKFNSIKARNFLELNFHRRAEDFSFTKSDVSFKVVKELRLNFNSNLLADINPDVKVIVVVRDYASNIKSIMKYVKEGGLNELQSILNLKGNEEDYLSLMNYWVESYNSIIEGLEDSKIEHHIVSHSSLLMNGVEEVQKIFSFIKLDVEDQVVKYLGYSNSDGSGKHNIRRSHNDLLKQKVKAQRELAPLLSEEEVVRAVHPKVQSVL